MERPTAKKRFTAGLAVLLAAGLIAVISADALRPGAKKRSATAFLMGSLFTVDVYGGAEELCGAAVAAATALERRISRTIEDSYISLIDRDGACTCDGAFADEMTAVLALCRETGGAFDITVGALSDLWDVGGKDPRVPSQEEIAAALALTGHDKIERTGFRFSVPAGVRLDLGAAGKGMACDAAKQVISEDPKVKGALVVSGGSIFCFGKAPGKSAWTIGVRDPDGGENDLAGVIKTQACFLSTSGNYEKYFEKDGVRYCHILSPFDGRPVDNGLKSVTVRANSGLQSDALSTACFVLGEEKSLPVLTSLGADAVFIYDDGTVSVTEGLAEDFSIVNDAYRLRGDRP